MQQQVSGAAYAVLLGDDSWAEARIAPLVEGRKLLIVTDANVAPLHLDAVRSVLSSAARIETLVQPPGESEKTLAGFARIMDALVAGGFHRDAIVVALGGGVIGDMAGFAAACYQRGVDWIVAPTTLLAQVDAALGGKTAVNHPAGKNLIGAFHDPLAVWANPAWLATLPEREYRAGFGEIVKYALGFDAELFSRLENRADTLLGRDVGALSATIECCMQIKLEVVATDRTERGARALLNLGHTLGHAIETALGHGTWLHGEAVAAGLVAATELSAARDMLDAEMVVRLRKLLSTLGLPIAIPEEADDEALMDALALDKKIIAGQLRFIGLDGLGHAEIWSDVTHEELAHTIAATRQ